uniref:Uncharacterized protein n=1 Tax=Pipistrellus kuhlii TaxID=59472 RepID=A0A7J8B0V2_PIPKU|nr:hypothetical protein mPipKuh1_007648 [Pipistrellus kuhlii]
MCVTVSHFQRLPCINVFSVSRCSQRVQYFSRQHFVISLSPPVLRSPYSTAKCLSQPVIFLLFFIANYGVLPPPHTISGRERPCLSPHLAQHLDTQGRGALHICWVSGWNRSHAFPSSSHFKHITWVVLSLSQPARIMVPALPLSA